jgi:arylsulfatase
MERGPDAPRYPGQSRVPLFATDGSSRSETIWFSHEGNRALRMGDWKIVAAGAEAAWELYDLSNDRSETRNRAKEKPEKLKELVDRWTREAADYRKWAEKDAPPEQPAKARKKAKA